MIKRIDEGVAGGIVVQIEADENEYFMKFDSDDVILLREFLAEKRKRDLKRLGYDWEP